MIVVSILTFDPGNKYIEMKKNIWSRIFQPTQMVNFVELTILRILMSILQILPKLYKILIIQGRRVCVSSCPKEGDKKLSCRMTSDVGCKFTSTPGFEVEYYDNIKK